MTLNKEPLHTQKPWLHSTEGERGGKEGGGGWRKSRGEARDVGGKREAGEGKRKRGRGGRGGVFGKRDRPFIPDPQSVEWSVSSQIRGALAGRWRREGGWAAVHASVAAKHSLLKDTQTKPLGTCWK